MGLGAIFSNAIGIALDVVLYFLAINYEWVIDENLYTVTLNPGRRHSIVFMWEIA